jgi:hypothetical protein
MLKSETKELYEQIEKLQQEIKEIRKKECLKLKGIKAIVRYSHSLLWGYSIENIYFDTFNHFLGLKESDSKSNWNVYYGSNSGPEQGFSDYSIYDKTTEERYIGKIINYENRVELKLEHENGEKEIIYTNKNICSVSNSNEIKTLDIYVPLNTKLPTTLYFITFNPYILTYDSAIDMANNIIKFYFNKVGYRL